MFFFPHISKMHHMMTLQGKEQLIAYLQGASKGGPKFPLYSSPSESPSISGGCKNNSSLHIPYILQVFISIHCLLQAQISLWVRFWGLFGVRNMLSQSGFK